YGFSWGDYNNDGLTDIFTVNAGQKNSLYKNDGGSVFTKVNNEIVSQEGIWSVATNLIDYNNDGKLDLFVTNRFSNHYNYLYKNIFNTGNFITIRLRGCENKFGIGARIKVVANDMVQMKEVQSGSGWGSNSSLWSHFGLGNAEIIDSIIIKWPSDSTAVYTDIPVNLNIRISECGPENIISINSNEVIENLSYKLYQNFPNPFNPATVIKYEIPVNSFVSLKVYDVLGNEVASLVNEFKNSGNYQTKWDASGFSNGIYFYKIETNKFSETRKMLLVK
nr:ASPIC/UnbV domain-containing protein [Ignavibacteria bacterium]